MKKAPLISDFRKKISPQVGLEPTKMRQDLKKSVSVLPEGDEKILSFRWDFSTLVGNSNDPPRKNSESLYCIISYTVVS